MISRQPVILIIPVGMLTLLMVAGTVLLGLLRLNQMVIVLLSYMLTVDWLDHVSSREMVMPVKLPAMVLSSLAVMVMMVVNSKVISNSLTCLTIQQSPKSLLLTIVASTLNIQSDAIIQNRHLMIASKLHTNQITNTFWMNTMMVASVTMKITKAMTITDTLLMMILMITISMNTTMMNTVQTKLKLMNQTIMIWSNQLPPMLLLMWVVVEEVHPVLKVHQV